MKIKYINETSFIIYFKKEISQNTSKKVKAMYHLLKDQSFVIDIVCSYNSILVEYNFLENDFKSIKSKVLNYKNDLSKIDINVKKNTIKIPVLYSPKVAYDLEKLSDELNLSIEEIISLHTSKSYDVYALGFMPGFAYLGDLHKKLYSNRLKNPRKSVPKGCVAIANLQTAIYPQSSPGGWNIIGKTPIEMFSKEYNNYSYIQMENKIEFYEINEDEYLSMGGEL